MRMNNSPCASVAAIVWSSSAVTSSSVCGAITSRVAPTSMSAPAFGSVQNELPEVTG